MNTKIKSYGDKTNTNFQGKKKKKNVKENTSYEFLSLRMLDSVIKKIKSLIPMHFWKNVNMK